MKSFKERYVYILGTYYYYIIEDELWEQCLYSPYHFGSSPSRPQEEVVVDSCGARGICEHYKS